MSGRNNRDVKWANGARVGVSVAVAVWVEVVLGLGVTVQVEVWVRVEVGLAGFVSLVEGVHVAVGLGTADGLHPTSRHAANNKHINRLSCGLSGNVSQRCNGEK